MRYIKEPSRDFIFHSVFGCVLNVSVVRAFARLFISMIRFFVLRRLLRLIFCLYLLWSIILGVFIGFVLKSGRWFKKERSHIHWDWAHKTNILTNVRRSAHRIPNKHNVRDSPKKRTTPINWPLEMNSIDLVYLVSPFGISDIKKLNNKSCPFGFEWGKEWVN